MVPLRARPAALWIRLYSLCIKTQQLFISLMILLAAGRSLAQVFRAKSTKAGGRCQETETCGLLCARNAQLRVKRTIV